MISGTLAALLVFLLPFFGVHLTPLQTGALVVTVVAVVKGIAFVVALLVAYRMVNKKETDSTPPASS